MASVVAKSRPLNPDAPSFYVESSKPLQQLKLPHNYNFLYHHHHQQPIPQFLPYPTGQLHSHRGLFCEQQFRGYYNHQTFYATSTTTLGYGPQTQLPPLVYARVGYCGVATAGGGGGGAESEVMVKVGDLEKGDGIKRFERGGFRRARRDSILRSRGGSEKTYGRGEWRRKIKSNCDETAARVSGGVHSSPPPPLPLPSPPPSPSDDVSFSGKTTIMVKNIPNQYRRDMLLDFLDNHCEEQNQKEAKVLSDPLHFAYDFVYLPMDFWTGDNLGYAFVNFTSAGAAKRSREVLDKYKWGVFRTSYSNAPHESKKICEINWARIQGKEELVKHFKNSQFLCHNVGYLPVVFSPPRNGATSFTMPTTIGKYLVSVPHKSSMNMKN